MKRYNITDMFKGWFIGNFDPSIIKTEEFEVAHHFHEAGYIDEKGSHYHKVATEVNYIIKGDVIVDGVKLTSGDFFVYEPYDNTDVQFISDTDLIVIKTPSCINDKYFVNE